MAIIGAIPVTLLNGNTADATQVMTDLNWIVSQVNTNAAGLSGNNTFTGTQSFQGVVTVIGGAANNPGIQFAGSSATGFYSPGANEIGFSINGALATILDASGNLGVGATSGGARLHILQPGTISPSNGILMESSAQSANQYTPAINFSAANVVASIYAQRMSSSGGNLLFATQSTSGGAPAVQLTLDNVGNLGVGQASNGVAKLLVAQPGTTSPGSGIVLESSALSAGQYTPGIFFSAANVNAGIYSQRLSSSGGTLIFATQPTAGGAPVANLSLDSSGRLAGVALHNNASGMAGTSAQFIGSGTYTPSNVATGSNVNVASATPHQFQYTRVGNVVTMSGVISVTTTSGTNTISSWSLPIASTIGFFTLAGTVNQQGIPANTPNPWVAADATNNAFSLNFNAAAGAAYAFGITISYVVA